MKVISQDIDKKVKKIEEQKHRLLKRRETQHSAISAHENSMESDIFSQNYRSNAKRKHKTSVKDFELGNKIGAGTFGVIFRAVEKKTQHEFALKVIKKSQIQTREYA